MPELRHVILIKPGVPDHNGRIFTREALSAMAKEQGGGMFIDEDGNLCASVAGVSMGAMAPKPKCSICSYADQVAQDIAHEEDKKFIRAIEEGFMEKYGVEIDETKTKTASAKSGKCPECGGELTQEDAWGPITGGAYIEHCPKCGTKPFEKKQED